MYDAALRKAWSEAAGYVLVPSEQTYINLSLRRLSQCADVAIADIIGSHCVICCVVFAACPATGKIWVTARHTMQLLRVMTSTIFLDIINIRSYRAN
jgi:hypothetical protein